MAKIIQHIPAFFDGFENKIGEFNSLEELLEIPFVKNFSQHKTFYKYSISENRLMCENKEGKEWWVIGTLQEIDNLKLDLPKWVPIR